MRKLKIANALYVEEKTTCDRDCGESAYCKKTEDDNFLCFCKDNGYKMSRSLRHDMALLIFSVKIFE